ncbi:pentatricopeptide repeat-containing protein At2g17525, mitochondrial [Punica granatum]|uniref:Pentatricopeptide repeat-containing protein At2g17525, mitochondrial n=2 Tax=Punica granatum TaxID=22663 RepID=A0A218W8B0_PUNGR|nr:pentatricopeptide repeat-containing protein At2g17525, mitochondrial [Punica granatum]OWM68332.1 hypothetical protein CDL15_Pgr004814 [Punica granatum]
MLRLCKSSRLSHNSSPVTQQISLLLFLSKPISSSALPRSPSSSSSTLVPSHDHIARLILDQKTASSALHAFQWAASLPGFTHSQSTYRALVHKLCSFRRFDAVHHLLDEMSGSIGSPPDEDIFLTIVRGLGRARMIKDSIKVLDLVRKFDREPSLKVYNSVLDVLVKEDIDVAREFYRKKMMGHGVEGDEYTFGILMKGLCLTNRIGDGFKLLQVMKLSSVKPNTVIYNTLLHALCKNGKVGRARSLMSEMDEPNDVTFNILISGYCKEENLVQALVLLEKSFSLGFVPDLVTVTKVLELLCNSGRVMEAVEVLERVESKGGAVDVVAYNALIKGFCNSEKVKLGRRLMKDMESKGCLPNLDTYNVLITGFCDSNMLDAAMELFDEMKTDGVRWNFDTFDGLIHGLCSGGRVQDGFKILELMEENKGGSSGRISPYNSILYGLYREGQMHEALDFMIRMERLFPRQVERSSRILRSCREASMDDAMRVYEQMNDEGGSTSVIVYDALIRGFCEEDRVRESFEIMNEMISSRYFPTASTFNCLINTFCQQGKVPSGLKLLEDLVGRGCMPDGESYAPLIDGFCRTRDLPRAWKVLVQMVEKGVCPNYLVWECLLRCLTQDTAWSESDHISRICNLSQQDTET